MTRRLSSGNFTNEKVHYMNNICPVCHTLVNTKCDTCGFELPAHAFLNEEDAIIWFRENVIPLQEKWNNSKKYKVIVCKTCGKELQEDWKVCPYCLTPPISSYTEKIIDNTTVLFTDEAIFAQPATPKTSQPGLQPVQAKPQNSRQHLELDGFILINSGTFTMGSPNNDPARYDNEGLQHQVTLRSFYMGKYQVTQEEYEAVMGINPSLFKGPHLPVEQVNWFEAIEYCNQRSQREGLSLAYTIYGSGDYRTVIWNHSANGYRLPTEVEWEYACRAGTTTRYNTGDNITKNQANYDKSYGRTTPVGSFNPNAWGLYDMHGNVWEWCWDLDDYDSEQADSMGVSSESGRVLRGGSWVNPARDLRSVSRSIDRPYHPHSTFGFRLSRY